MNIASLLSGKVIVGFKTTPKHPEVYSSKIYLHVEDNGYFTDALPPGLENKVDHITIIGAYDRSHPFEFKIATSDLTINDDTSFTDCVTKFNVYRLA
jgi:hypothetical protein